jgi:drug/metabolite transporter superfamily protein YnfA
VITSLWLKCILTFVCGALYEITSCYWLYSAEQRKPLKAAAWSMVQALVMLTGIGESVKDWRTGTCFVLGYSFGSGIAVYVAARGNAPSCRAIIGPGPANPG